MDTTSSPNSIAHAPSRFPAHAALALYALLLAPIYALPVFTPDEIWFQHDAIMISDAWREMTTWEVFWKQENHLGYGAAYWFIYVLFARISSQPLLLMRGVAMAACLTIPFWIWRRSRDEQQRPAALISMLVWFTFTAAWWTGKVTGPELISTAFLFSGLHLLSLAVRLRGALVAGLLIGFGMGLKFNGLSTALLMFFILPQLPRPWRMLSGLLIGVGLGLLVANPFLLVDPASFLANVRRPGRFGDGFTTNHLIEISWNTGWEWEGVFRGGYFNWCISPFAAPLYLLLLWKGKLPWNWFVGGLTCTVCAFLLYLTSRTYQGWYWLPLATLFPLSLLHLRQVDLPTKRLAFAVIIVNLLGNAPWIGMQYYSKLEQFAHSFEQRNVLEEAKEVAAEHRDGLIVAILDQGVDLRTTPEASGDDSPKERREIVEDLSGFFLLNELRFGRRELAPGETWTVIHDQRLRKYNPIVDPARDAPRLGPDYVIEVEQGRYITAMKIHRKSLSARKTPPSPPKTRR